MEENKFDATNNKVDPNSDQVVIIEEKISKVNGEIAIKRYSKGKMLGKGGFAKVFEVKNLETNKSLAGKIIQKSTLNKNRARQKLISEIKIHKSLHHPNIVNFEHVFEDQENVYILLEICANQTLNELLKRRKKLHEIEVQCYVSQIINALKYLHSVRVIHRDLKLGNLFLNDALEIKIGDFGLATKLEFDGEKKRTICGTPNYIAPEVLDGKTGHSYEVDIWSLGVIIYTLLIGKPPFETPDVKTTYKKIKMNNYTFPEHATISENAKNLITKILLLDPLKRPTLDEILLHPFLNNGGFIPKNLPLATLACPPSTNWLKQWQFNPASSQNMKTALNQQQKLLETAPVNQYNQTQTIASNFNFKTDQAADLYSSSSNWKQDSNLKGGTPNKTAGLQSMKSLTNGLQSPNNGMQSLPNLNKAKTTSSGMKTEVWVKKWVDYSNKYGLGYVLTNGATGVFFNDGTKLILDPKGINLEYYEVKNHDKQEIITSYPLNDYPPALKKKVTLLQHFKIYLEGEKCEKINPSEFVDDGQKVYVKKWMKTKHAIMFRLSNKIVQVNFTDKSELVLSSENKMLTYISKKGEKSTYPLLTALESSNHEMAKRLKYTKEILTHMINNNSTAANGNMMTTGGGKAEK